MVFLTVKFSEILHASAYDIYNYIYKVGKNATASARLPAAARRGGQRGTRAHYIVMQSILEKKLSVILPSFVYYSIVRAVVAATRVGRMAISQDCHPWHFF